LAGVRETLDRWFPKGSSGRWLLSGFRANPISFIGPCFRSLAASRRLAGKARPISVRVGAGQRLVVNRASTANVVVEGVIDVRSWGGSNAPSSITCGDGATLIVAGDFEIGPGVHIEVARNATLKIGGRRNSSGSGITCDCRIMVERSVEIGADSIVAWGVSITDSDWHDIEGSTRCEPVSIGEKVWIAHGATIAKGAVVPSGCIVGAKSYVSRAEFPEKSLIAGTPATVRRTPVEWSR